MSIYNKRWLLKNPWFTHWDNAKQRCVNPKSPSYKYYGGRGIEFLMTVAEFKRLWFRDKAYLMKRPSIDRKDSKGNYVFKNCQFMELSKNAQKQAMGKIKYERKVNQYDKDMNFIQQFDSLKKAGECVGQFGHNIGIACQIKTRTCGGYYWRYAEKR